MIDKEEWILYNYMIFNNTFKTKLVTFHHYRAEPKHAPILMSGHILKNGRFIVSLQKITNSYCHSLS